jgi:hypothetical protein
VYLYAKPLEADAVEAFLISRSGNDGAITTETIGISNACGAS